MDIFVRHRPLTNWETIKIHCIELCLCDSEVKRETIVCQVRYDLLVPKLCTLEATCTHTKLTKQMIKKKKNSFEI